MDKYGQSSENAVKLVSEILKVYNPDGVDYIVDNSVPHGQVIVER